MLLVSNKQIKTHNDVITNTLSQRKQIEDQIHSQQADHERDSATQTYQTQQLELENKKLEEVLNRQEQEMVQSRFENDDLEKRQQEK